MTGNGMVDSYQYTVAIAQAAQKLGAEIVEGTVTGLKQEGSEVTGVNLETETLPCKAVVFATGPWVAGPESWLGINVPVTPIKGELLLVDTQGPSYEHHISRQGSGLYILPDGRIYLGGTQEDVGFDTKPTTHGRDVIFRDNEKLVPNIKNAKVVEHVAAFRPATRDGYPMLGKVPGWDNVYLATGAGTKGVLTSAGMGEAVACLIAGRQPPVAIEAFAPERFDVPKK